MSQGQKLATKRNTGRIPVLAALPYTTHSSTRPPPIPPPPPPTSPKGSRNSSFLTFQLPGAIAATLPPSATRANIPPKVSSDT